jgi:acetyl esterase/lipase
VTTPGRGGELAVQIALNATVARITPEALQVLISDWLNELVTGPLLKEEDDKLLPSGSGTACRRW